MNRGKIGTQIGGVLRSSDWMHAPCMSTNTLRHKEMKGELNDKNVQDETSCSYSQTVKAKSRKKNKSPSISQVFLWDGESLDSPAKQRPPCMNT